jgi:hypothetical protein
VEGEQYRHLNNLEVKRLAVVSYRPIAKRVTTASRPKKGTKNHGCDAPTIFFLSQEEKERWLVIVWKLHCVT